jgi:hypothetical protein
MERSPAWPVARLLSPLVPLVAAFVVWRPLLDNYFYADDFLHLFDLVTLPLARFLTQIWGGHLYLVRNGVFAAMYAAFGPEPRPWFWSVLLTHVLNVLLLHRLILRTTGDALVACLGATLWGTSPALEGALGWYAVYGQVLLTTLVLVVCGALAGVIISGRSVSTARALAWGALLAAGAACFGTGLGIAAAFPLVIPLALHRRQHSLRTAVLLALTAAAVFAAYMALWNRSTDIDARARALLSSASILAATPAVLALGAALMGFSASTLVLGPLGLDTGYPDVPTLGAAALVGVLLAAGAVAADATQRRRFVWLAVLLVAACATIAAGRATILTSWQVSIERSAAWPRYHYLLLALLTSLVCLALAALRALARPAGALVTAGVTVWLAVCLVLPAVRPHAIDHHDAERTETDAALRAIGAAIAAAPPGSTVTIRNRPFIAAQIGHSFPGWAGVFMIHFPANTVDGRRVRFIARASDVVAEERGGRVAELLGSP